MKNIIQIAGVMDQQEANMLMSFDVNLLGFPLRLPVNKEDLSEDDAQKIIKSLPDSFFGVLITYQNKADEIIDFCRQMGAKHIQLHGDINVAELNILKQRCPEITIFKSLVTGKNTLEELKETVRKLTPFVDAFITDTFDPITGASGATGKTHDWSISRELREFSSKPLILAGGLNAENVYESIIVVKPAGIDCHTGIENDNGRKDFIKTKRFVEEARRAFSDISKGNN